MTYPGDGRFPSTHWTLIARIKSTDEAVATKAIDEICVRYHYPLYCYLRRRGCNHHDAQDVLHDFLARLLHQQALERLDEAKGRLRGYLALALGRHLQRWRQKAHHHGAGVGASIDFAAVESRYQSECFNDGEAPDRIFERKWATEMLLQVIRRLGDSYHDKGKSALFTILRPALENGGSLRGEDSLALAAQAGLSEPTLRTAMSRLMAEFREILRAEVRQTVESPDDLPGELSYLTSLFQD